MEHIFSSIFPPLVRPSLQHAAELVKTVASRYDEYVSVKDLSDKINRALTAAKKDNDFIYHDRVPEVKDLEHIGKAALVKATTITPPLSQKFTGQTLYTAPYCQDSLTPLERHKTEYLRLSIKDKSPSKEIKCKTAASNSI